MKPAAREAARIARLNHALARRSARPAPPPENAIKLSISASAGRVVVDYGRPIVWLPLSPAEARNVAAALVEQAAVAESS